MDNIIIAVSIYSLKKRKRLSNFLTFSKKRNVYIKKKYLRMECFFYIFYHIQNVLHIYKYNITTNREWGRSMGNFVAYSVY